MPSEGFVVETETLKGAYDNEALHAMLRTC